MLALICKHFNMPGPQVDGLNLAEFIQFYATALDLDEREMYEKFVLAGGDPAKFPWSEEWKAPDLVGDKIFRLAGEMKAPPRRVDLAEIAEIQGGMDVVYRQEDGSFVDADGNPVKVPPGSTFVESKKLKQAMLDMMGNESSPS